MAAEDVEKLRLLDQIQEQEEERKRYLRKAILEHKRADVLASEILGLQVKPFHRKLQRFALKHPETLELAFRGSGKTTTVTITLIVLHIILNRDVRILVASRTKELANDILKEVKLHLENELLVELFGDFKGGKGTKWAEREIIVSGRERPMKEGTVTTVGTEGQVVGKHYDIIFGDDLVDETNSKTSYQRKQVWTFYYKVLYPCLEPDGELHIFGTRYHDDDLYGYLQENDMEGTTLIIPALDEKGRSPWPEMWPAATLLKRKKKMGTIIFDTQYQCDTEKMRGEIFQYDWMEELKESEIPSAKGRRLFLGVDLAIGEKEHHDKFAMVLIAKVKGHIYVLKHFEGHLKFSQQVKKIVKWFDKYDPEQVAVEANAYQAALANTIKEKYPRVRVKKVYTKTDKIVRANKLSARFEGGDISFVEGNRDLIDHLVMFPKEKKDLFDALDFAVKRAYVRKRRDRQKEIPSHLHGG
jgi:predicted phage terminase large subunit-like protein